MLGIVFVGYGEIVYEGQPSLDAVMYFERKAMGGAATITCGEVVVDPDEFTEGRWPREITKRSNYNYPRLASAITRHGAVAVIELQFTGIESRARGAKRDDPAWGPVDMVRPNGGKVVAMTEERFAEVIEGFGVAAKAAKGAGFGMVCVHGAHEWGLMQFMSPSFNTRTDRWGAALKTVADSQSWRSMRYTGSAEGISLWKSVSTEQKSQKEDMEAKKAYA